MLGRRLVAAFACGDVRTLPECEGERTGDLAGLIERWNVSLHHRRVGEMGESPVATAHSQQLLETGDAREQLVPFQIPREPLRRESLVCQLQRHCLLVDDALEVARIVGGWGSHVAAVRWR